MLIAGDMYIVFTDLYFYFIQQLLLLCSPYWSAAQCEVVIFDHMTRKKS